LYCRTCKKFSPDNIEGDSRDSSVEDGLEKDVHRVLGPDGTGAELSEREAR
jgi:hypothetical protein